MTPTFGASSIGKAGTVNKVDGFLQHQDLMLSKNKRRIQDVPGTKAHDSAIGEESLGSKEQRGIKIERKRRNERECKRNENRRKGKDGTIGRWVMQPLVQAGLHKEVQKYQKHFTGGHARTCWEGKVRDGVAR